MGNLKEGLKFPSPPRQYCKPITQLDTTFAQCFSRLLRRVRGAETQNCPNSSFVTDCIHNFQTRLKILVLVDKSAVK